MYCMLSDRLPFEGCEEELRLKRAVARFILSLVANVIILLALDQNPLSWVGDILKGSSQLNYDPQNRGLVYRCPKAFKNQIFKLSLKLIDKFLPTDKLKPNKLNRKVMIRISVLCKNKRLLKKFKCTNYS